MDIGYLIIFPWSGIATYLDREAAILLNFEKDET